MIKAKVTTIPAGASIRIFGKDVTQFKITNGVEVTEEAVVYRNFKQTNAPYPLCLMFKI